MKIIDAHAHVARYIAGFTSRGELLGIGGGKAQYSTGEIFQMFPREMGNIGVSPEALLRVMDENGVEKAVLLQGNFLGFQNEFTYEAIQKYPSRFTGAATYNPYCKHAEDIKRHLFDELNFKAVKFELSDGSGLMADRPPFELTDSTMYACFEHAAEKNLTVVLDIGRPNGKCWQIDNLSKIIGDFPDITFVVCHLLAPQRGDNELLKAALSKLKYENLYFDISSLASNQKPEAYPYPTAVKHLKAAKEIVGADRLMFGTDMPMNLVRDTYAHLTDYIIESGVFTEGELEDIFYNTAKKVYFS